MTARRYYIPALDGLRFFCFLMVFFHHRTPNLLTGLSDDQQQWWHAAVLAGAYGVTAFFVLSSFLLTKLLQEEKADFGSVDIKKFYIRRALRIWPLYFLVLILDVVVWPLVTRTPIQWDLLAWFGSFSANFKMLERESIPMPTLILWSICVEEQFYLVWPWLNDRLSALSLRVCAWCMILAAVGFRCGAAGAGWWWSAAWFHSLGHLDAFGFGALAVMELSQIRLRPMEKNLLVVQFLPVCLLIGRFVPFAGIERPMDWWTALGFTLVPMSAAAAVWAASQIPAERPNFLSTKALVSLGQISFGLYVFHSLVNEALPRFMPGLAWPLEMVVRFTMTVLVAVASYALLERPLLRFKSKYQRVRSGSPQDPYVAHNHTI